MASSAEFSLLEAMRRAQDCPLRHRALPVRGMEWRANGILLNVRRHGENSAIIDALTHEHGVYSGLVRGGAGRKLAATLQPGNHLALRWKARLDEHLGAFNAELITSYAPEAMADREALATLDSMRALACTFLPERQPTAMFDMTKLVLDVLGKAGARRVAYAQWEVMLLAELGFGLDFKTCAATGGTEDLRYLSPRSGRAVSGAAGAAYAEKLFPLPEFLSTGGSEIDRDAFAQALAITGYFLKRWAGDALNMRDMPPAWLRLSSLVSRH